MTVRTTRKHIVYVLERGDEGIVYVGCTNDFDRRHAEHSRRREFAGCVMREVADSSLRLEAETIEAALIRQHRPQFNKVTPAHASGYAQSMALLDTFSIFTALFGDPALLEAS